MHPNRECSIGRRNHRDQILAATQHMLRISARVKIIIFTYTHSLQNPTFIFSATRNHIDFLSIENILKLICKETNQIKKRNVSS